MTLNDFIQKANSVYRENLYNYSKASEIKANKKICIICSKGYEFWQRPYDHLAGHGCKCHYSFCPKNLESFIDGVKQIYGDVYNYSLLSENFSDYRVEDKIPIICKKHGLFYPRKVDFLAGHGCKKCASEELSKDRKISDTDFILKAQKRFKTCRDKLPLPFDFYLPDYSICIEYQGEQHYKNAFFSKQNSYNLEKTQLHDQIKRDWCKNNNIKEIEIPYWEKDSISLILKTSLNLN